MRIINMNQALQIGNILMDRNDLLEQMPYAAWSHPDFQFKNAVHLNDAEHGKDYLSPTLTVMTNESDNFTDKAAVAKVMTYPIIRDANSALPSPNNALILTALAAQRLKLKMKNLQLLGVKALFIELEPYQRNMWRFDGAKAAGGADKIQGSNDKILHEWATPILFSHCHSQSATLVFEDRVAIHSDSGVTWTHYGKLEPSILDENTPIFAQQTTIARPIVCPDLTKCYRVLHIASDELVDRYVRKLGDSE